VGLRDSPGTKAQQTKHRLETHPSPPGAPAPPDRRFQAAESRKPTGPGQAQAAGQSRATQRRNPGNAATTNTSWGSSAAAGIKTRQGECTQGLHLRRAKLRKPIGEPRRRSKPGAARGLSQRGPSNNQWRRARQLRPALPATQGIQNRGSTGPARIDSSSTATRGLGAWFSSSLLDHSARRLSPLALACSPSAAVCTLAARCQMPPGQIP